MHGEILDIHALRHVTGGDPQIEGELATLYMETADRCLIRLSEPENFSAQERWLRIIHELKGASANMRAKKLVDACRMAELATETGGRVLAYRKLEAYYNELLPSLKALLSPQ